MRVVHLCQRDDPEIGGANEVARALVPRLQQRGIHARILFLYGPPGEISKELTGFTETLGLRSKKDAWKGIQVLRSRLRELNPDVLHRHDMLSWPSFATAFGGSYRRFWHGHLPPTKDSVKQRAAWAINHRTLDRILCVSESIRGRFLAAGFSPDSLTVLFNGVDLDRFVPPTATERRQAKAALGLPPSEPVVGFVGRLHNAMKGVNDILRGFEYLPDSYRLLIVGGGPDEASLRQLAEYRNVATRIKWTGAVRDSAPYYRAMDVFAFASHFEPFGLVLLEATASGLPIVAYPVSGGAPEILSVLADSAVTLAERDPKEWAAEIQNAISKPRPERPDALETFNWDAVANRLTELYGTYADR